MSEHPQAIGAVPLQSGVSYRTVFGSVPRPDLHSMVVWEADPWDATSLSWKENCYVHSGISGGQIVKGPDAQKLLSRISINDVYKWDVNRSKHLVMCDENGYITNHALTQKNGDDEFCMYAGNPWPIIKELQSGAYAAEMLMKPAFIFQISGPLSLTVVEKVTQKSQRDVRFLDVKKVNIPGFDTDFELCRIGMSGTLAYEFRGPNELGPQVYELICEAGKEHDIKRLGWKTYTVNHFEGGFPQQTVGFVTASVIDPVFLATPEMAQIGLQRYTGSIDPANVRTRLRTPGEVDWMWMAKFDHDFIGRQAVEKEAADPRRKIVNLKWNVDDVTDIYRSLFSGGEHYKRIELPCGQPQPAGGHADLVTTSAGKEIGVSSCTTYSYYYRDMLSQCVIDVGESALGNEVIVHWGDFGKRIKQVRATVVRYPYIDLPRNENYDLDTVPHGA